MLHLVPKKHTIIFFLLVIASVLFGQKPILITDKTESISLNDILDYYEDETGDLSIQDVKSLHKDKFRFLDGHTNLGFSRSSFWVRFEIKNKKAERGHPLWIIRANYPEIDYIYFYQFSEEGNLIDSVFTGTMRPVGTRQRPDKNIVFVVSVPFEETHTIYLHIATETPVMLDFSILTLDEYLRVNHNGTLLIGLYIGILLLAIGYYSILYYRLKDKVFLYLTLAGLALLLNILASGQFAYIYLWPDFIFWNKISVPILDALLLIFFIKFVNEFLETKKYLPAWYNSLQIIFYLLIILAISVSLFDFFIVSQLINICIALSLLIIIPLSYLSLRRGYVPARFFMLGIFLINPAGLYHLAIEFGLVPESELGRSAYLIASVFLVWFFSQAVSDRLHLLKAEKEKAEDDLSRSEAQLSLVVKGADLGTWVWDIKNNRFQLNARCRDILGLESDSLEIDLQTWHNQIHNDDKEHVTNIVNAHLHGERDTIEVEYRVKNKDRDWIWILDWGRIIEYDNSKKPVKATGTVIEITKRKHAEISQQIVYTITNAVSTTKDMHAFFETIHHELNRLFDAENFHVGLYNKEQNVINFPYSVDQQSRYTQISARKTCSAYVLKKKQAMLLKGADLKRLVSSGEIESYATSSKIWLGAPLQVEGQVIGIIFVQSYENENAYNEDDKALLAFVADQIANSIKQKHSEQALRESEEKFRLYVENAHDGIMIVGEDYNFEYVNTELSHILGYPLKEIIGQNFTKFLDHESKELVSDRYIRRQRGDKVPNRYEFSIIRKNGEKRNVEISSTVIKDSKGKIKTIAHLLDITGRKIAETALLESESRYKVLFNSASDAFLIMQDDKFIQCNRSALKMFACTRKQIIGQTPAKFSPPRQPDGSESGSKAMKKINAALAGKAQFFEWKHITLDGRSFDAEVSLNTIQLKTGLHIQAIVRDISSRKRSEHLLNVLNEAGMSMQNALTTGQIFKKVAETLEKHGFHFTYFTYNEVNKCLYSTFLSYSKMRVKEAEKIAGMKIKELVVPKKTAKEFIRALDKQELVFVPDGKALLHKMLPMITKEIIEKISRILSIPSLVLAPLTADNKNVGLVSVQSEELEETEIPAISVFINQLSNALKRAQHYEQVEREIAVRLETEKALKNSEEYFRSIIENTRDVILIINNSGNITYQSPSYERVLGYPSDHQAGNVFDYTHPADQSDLRTQFNHIKNNPGFTEALKLRYKHYKGSWRYFDGTMTNLLHLHSVNGIVVNFRDVTESQLLQEQLIQSQKMEAIGQLAGGVAHDFNNLLTVISGYTNLLLYNEEIPAKYKGKLDEIQKASLRAEALTRQLLAFSRKEIVQPIIVDINTIINNSIKMLRRLIGEDIQISLNLSDDLPAILSDPHQMEQILINLIVNSRDAIHANINSSNEKCVIIETKHIYLDDHYVKTHTGSRKGAHIELCISDTGIGMNKETIQKIFEPFFTTKEHDKGTGLGLSTIYGIVKQNHASINVYSEPGRGTTFKIYWPAAESKGESALKNIKPKIQKGSEHILIVEDDDGVRSFIVQALDSMGYAVYQAKNGKNALKLVKNKKIKPHLLITDIIMPEMDGKELANNIRDLFPDIRIIYTSGYTDNQLIDEKLLNNGVQFLGKPYAITSISSKVRAVLDKKS